MNLTVSSEGLEESFIVPAPHEGRQKRSKEGKSAEEQERKRQKRERRQKAKRTEKKAVATQQTHKDIDVKKGGTQASLNSKATRSTHAVLVGTEQTSAEVPLQIDKEVIFVKPPLFSNSPEAIAASIISSHAKDIKRSRNIFDPKDEDLVPSISEDAQPQTGHSSHPTVDRPPTPTTSSPTARAPRSDTERFPFRYPEPLSDMDSGSDFEETIVTAGAQATLSRPSRTPLKSHLLANSNAQAKESDDEEPEDSDGEQENTSEPVRHVGFPSPDELPKWFPKSIKKMYEVDRHGGALTFKELNQITRFRFALSPILRRKWRTYLAAGEARFKLQNAVRRLRVRAPTRAFYEFRQQQYRDWKAKALRAWRKLEKTHLGVVVLDATIGINFRQERMIYEKRLRGRM
ncbi:unnamed protein product [Diplocarpon coronariae]|uniref:Uncharacterized protein n=1 Tax=Diplocarpon coronariae TaxID=2795749 RepID=A0A218YW46_9HELO|nr:hypothetical protein B2J93_9452 [Marssonina coronariae]